VRALFLSVFVQGIRGKARRSYWQFLFCAATLHGRSFGAAMTLAAMGYHFQIVTERLSEAET
jgi:hypothetical protein